jgi:hypothetical protein
MKARLIKTKTVRISARVRPKSWPAASIWPALNRSHGKTACEINENSHEPRHALAFDELIAPHGTIEEGADNAT